MICPRPCPKKRCELMPVGEARLDQVGGFLPAVEYRATSCPFELVVIARSGEWRPDPAQARIA